MSSADLNTRAARLREIMVELDALNAEADAIRDEMKGAMIDAGTEILTGPDWKATWKTVTSSRLDTAALKKALPDIAAQYTKQTTTCRFCFT